MPLRSSGPSNTGGVGWLTRKCTAFLPISIGTSQWDFEERRNTSSSAGEYHGVPGGSSGSSAPGMSFHKKFWNVRMPEKSIGYLEYTAIPNWPGKKPNPNASFGPPTMLLLSRSNPDGMPVLDGAVYRYG